MSDTFHIFGHDIPKKTAFIGGGLIAAAVAVVVWLRARSASAAAAQAPPMPPPDTSGASGGAMSIPAYTPAQADQYSNGMLQDQLAALGLATQYQYGLQQSQQSAAALQASSNPLATAEAQNAGFFAANPLSSATPTGVTQENWKQFLLNGTTIWEDVSGQNRAPLTESLAEQVGAQAKGEGPYYKSKGGGIFKPLIDAGRNIINGVVQGSANAAQSDAGAYFAAQGVPFQGAPTPVAAQAPTPYVFSPTSQTTTAPWQPPGLPPVPTATVQRVAPHGYPEAHL